MCRYLAVAWIEMRIVTHLNHSRSRRYLAVAWIEIRCTHNNRSNTESLPRGSVD